MSGHALSLEDSSRAMRMGKRGVIGPTIAKIKDLAGAHGILIAAPAYGTGNC
jgi:hypothetical protein